MTAPTVEELQAQLTALQTLLGEAWAPVVYRDIWADEVRLRVDGRDWTWFRGVPAQVGGYQRQEPYTYGFGDFAFPQVTGLEVAKFGKKGHPLRPLRLGAIVELIPIKDGHSLPQIEWRGFITQIKPLEDRVEIHCDGDVSGRLAHRDKQPVVFPIKKDLGLEIADNLAYCGVKLKPREPVLGLKVQKRGGGSDVLGYVDELLAMTLQMDGDQKTIAAVGNGRRYALVDKDTTTIHATVFYGSQGVSLDVVRDLAEEPRSIFGRGTDPTGQKWINPAAPNFTRGTPPPFPGIMAKGYDGPALRSLLAKLIGQRYVSRLEVEGAFDDDVEDAVKDLQDDAGLPQTGVVDAATWRALFNVDVTGLSFAQAQVMPLAQWARVKQWLRTANGSVYAPNPDHDPDEIHVDLTVDHGEGVFKRRARKWSRRYMQRLRVGKNWYGTLAIDPGVGVFAGDVTADTVDPAPMSADALLEGMNIKVVGFDGETLFHIAGKDVDGERAKRFAIDTRGRDLLVIGQMIARNKESRSHPARRFVREQRRGGTNDLVIFSELGGWLDEDVPLHGGRWNKIGIPAGQSGTLQTVDLKLRDAKCEYVAMVLMRNRSEGRIAKLCGNPFADDTERTVTIDGETETRKNPPRWQKPWVQQRLKRRHLQICAWGQRDQPLGYWPDAKFGEDNKRTGATLTGDWTDEAGVNFTAVDDCAFYLFIYPRQDCVLQAGHLFKVLQTEGS